MPDIRPIQWTSDEYLVVWAALRAQLGVLPDIEPKKATLKSAFDKLNRAIKGAPGMRPLADAPRAKGIDE